MTTEINGAISVPISISGEMVSQLYITSGIAISPSIAITLSSPLHYDCEGGAVVFPVFTVYGESIDSQFGTADITFPIFTVELTGALSPVGIGMITLPLLSVKGTATLSALGSASLSIPLLSVNAEGNFGATGTLSITFPLMQLSASGLSGIKGTFDKSFPFFTIVGTGLDSITGTASLEFPLFTLDAYSVLASGYLSMVMNTKNKALSLYNNYDFNSFCRFNGRHFGATSTAIYDLDTGTTDNGTLVEWNFRLPYLDLERKNKKKLSEAWVSYKSSDAIKVKIIQPNGEEFEYDLENIDTSENGIRVKFGRGIKSKYVTLDFSSVDGCSATIDSIKLHFIPIQKVR
jgi:hypothetical protein